MSTDRFIRGDRVVFGAKSKKECYGEFLRYNSVNYNLCYIRMIGHMTGCAGVPSAITNDTIIDVSYVKHAPSVFRDNNPNATFKERERGKKRD